MRASSLAVIGSVLFLAGCDTTGLVTSGGYGGVPGGYRPAYGGYGAPPVYGPGYAPGYGGGYDGAYIEERRIRAYQVGRKVGASDYRAGRRKSYGRHDSLYDRSTEEAFKQGFYAGYEEARERDKRR